MTVAKDSNKEDKKKPENVVEAALFSAGRPLSVEEIADTTRLSQGPIRRAVKRLIKRYKKKDTAIEVAKVGARYTMQVKTAYGDAAIKVAPGEIPRKLIKTLTLIAYHQPIKQSELKTMIGDKVYEHVRELVSLGMVHTRRFGATKILITSKRFPEYFGIGTASRAGIKKWIADKVGIKPSKSKVPIKQFEEIAEDMEAEAEAAAAEGAADVEEEGALPEDAEGAEEE
jgi:segregation and condensation protein B